MLTNTYSRWKVGAGTFAAWFLAVACVGFWGLRLSAGASTFGAPALPAAPTVVDAQALTRLLGGVEAAAAEPAVAATRYTLVGVLAGLRSGHGAALIEVDDKPAKPFRIGAEVAQGLVLQSLGRREAHLGASVDGPSSMTLRMPLKAASSTDGGAASPASSLPGSPKVQSPMIPQGQTPGIAPASTSGHAPLPPRPRPAA